MYPLWEVAIAPVLEAARAKRIVEIGALRGETTVQILESLAPGSELHVIDPAPDFDPAEHERSFPGRYMFHRALSLDVLQTLEAVDAALIDGDHNWYTVYHELKLLAEAARRAGQPLPVLVMHDVGWPYGRRDLYYAPETIPDEFRHPYTQAGMTPRRKTLWSRGGLNPRMNNAEVEGGPRNGVMTALEDFMGEHDQPLRFVLLPIYYGLAIVAEERRLEEEPTLAAALDRLEGAEGRYELLQVAEEVRLRAMIFQHNVFYQRAEEAERATARYLKVVKAALLNQHYLDHEVRLAHLVECVSKQRQPDPVKLRDPVRYDQGPYRSLERRRLGPAGPDATAARSFLPYTAMGRARLDHLERCLDAVRTESLPGDLVECGTGRGGGAMFMRAYLEGHEIPDRRVWVADRFRASPEPDTQPDLRGKGLSELQADLNLVRDGFARFDLLDDRVRFLQGPMAATLRDAPIDELALLHIGLEGADETRAVLENLYDRLSPGGFVLVDNGADETCRSQVDTFRAERGITATLEQVDASAIAWRKAAAEPVSSATTATPTVGTPRAPLASPAPTDTLDLSVVVVFYNMRREAQRTLHSLSRAYQEGIDDVSYEVIVVENGSDPEQRLGEQFVAGFGPEFRYVDVGDAADPSPVTALNRGIRMTRGRNLALMIDGAHVLTPGVLRFGLAGLSTYAPAIVATQQWYMGPGQQGDAMDDDYDQAYEDRLFETIDWPVHGYRLFNIGHFVGDRDWLDGVWESNCMFAPRSLLEQIGCFDETFSMPGGGYANLELYERLGSSPDITVVSILGEGSFHQIHGGNTTNQPDATERRARVFGYGQHYAELRGRSFKGPGKPIHYVGRFMIPNARRTRARRMSAEAFNEAAAADDGPPESPLPVPEELRRAFTDSVWRSMPWDHTTWLGHRIRTAPTDLLAYQEMIARVRPDFVVETGTGDGGRALFLASICELIGHGHVISVDREHTDDLPRHPRLRYVTGRAHDAATVSEVRAIVGEEGRAVVILGSCTTRQATRAEFDAYAPFVPVGSYVVVTDTIVNGHPVWPAFGPGPGEAVKQILSKHGEFVPDPAMEKHSLTFNPGGFLHRVR